MKYEIKNLNRSNNKNTKIDQFLQGLTIKVSEFLLSKKSHHKEDCDRYSLALSKEKHFVEFTIVEFSTDDLLVGEVYSPINQRYI